jgi:hypothetical protein
VVHRIHVLVDPLVMTTLFPKFLFSDLLFLLLLCALSGFENEFQVDLKVLGNSRNGIDGFSPSVYNGCKHCPPPKSRQAISGRLTFILEFLQGSFEVCTHCCCAQSTTMCVCCITAIESELRHQQGFESSSSQCIL